MKKQILLLLIINILFFKNLNSQDIISDNDNLSSVSIQKSTGNVSNGGVVINFEMIDRFNNVAKDEEYLTWGDLILGYDVQSLQDFYYAYITCDIEKESLKDIKLALEENKIENEKILRDYDTEYLARLMNLKIIIDSQNGSKIVVQKTE
jgi:hypothetical protein